MNFKRLFIFILSAFLSLSLFGETGKKVRVAYYSSKNFQEGSDDGKIKSGYSYEYLQKIANETGWSYEYVYGNIYDLWIDFIDGKIDIMAGLGKYGDAQKNMLFPDFSMGKESYYILKHRSDSSISPSDVKTLNGKKIGALSNNIMSAALTEWLRIKNIDSNIILFASADDRDSAYLNGEVDCVVNELSGFNEITDYYPLYKIYDNNYYLAVTKSRPDILTQLNQALVKINDRDPEFLNGLTSKYFKNTLFNRHLSEAELAWVENHPVLKIGFVKDYLPFCDVINGTTTGILKDVMDEILTELELTDKIKVEYIFDSDYWNLFVRMENGECDVVFPSYKSLWHSEQFGSRETEEVCPAVVDFVYTGDFSTDKSSEIAISLQSPIQRIYADLYLPESKLVKFDNSIDCLEAIKNGTVQSTLLSSYRSSYYLNTGKFNNLKTIQLATEGAYCFSIPEGNPELLGILNKGISQINRDKINFLIYEYTNNESLYDIQGFFIRHHWQFAIPITLIAIVLMIMGIYWITYIHKTNKKLQTQLNIVESLSHEYVNIYLIDIPTETFTVLKLQGFVPDGLLKDKIQIHPYMETITKYARDRVFEEDIENFIDAFKISNVERELSGRNEFRHKYRIMMENEIHYFQAKFAYLGNDSKNKKFLIAFANIDEEIKGAQRLETLKVQAETDGLTGVLNRGCGESTSREIITKGTKGVLLIMDVDKFKSINDTFGHETGDKVLIKVADCLKNAFREKDIIFRLGGDEFVVLAQEINSQNTAKRVITRFAKLIEKIDIPEMGDHKVTVSIGAKIFNEKENDFTKLYKLADAGVYESKKQDKTAITFVK